MKRPAAAGKLHAETTARIAGMAVGESRIEAGVFCLHKNRFPSCLVLFVG